MKITLKISLVNFVRILVEEGTGYPRSISNALKFYDTQAYNAIIAKVQASCGTQLLWRGTHYQKADLLRAMFAHTKTMLDVVYTQKPKAVQINSVVTAAQKLRDLLHLFDAPATPWGHVWTCHVPQYLQELGTLFPFLCHGFEGRWRQLKTDIKLSTHGQWKGAVCGFEVVLSYDVARWVLRKLQVRLKGRRYKVRKNNKRLWDAYKPWIHH